MIIAATTAATTTATGWTRPGLLDDWGVIIAAIFLMALFAVTLEWILDEWEYRIYRVWPEALDPDRRARHQDRLRRENILGGVHDGNTGCYPDQGPADSAGSKPNNQTQKTQRRKQW
jgi:hypothetical protein